MLEAWSGLNKEKIDAPASTLTSYESLKLWLLNQWVNNRDQRILFLTSSLLVHVKWNMQNVSSRKHNIVTYLAFIIKLSNY
jgi:hypothetical protein